MKISFNNALGIHADALSFRARRAEVLAHNLINADTPNFKARDIRFADVLNTANGKGVRMAATNDRHFGAQGYGFAAGEEMYRNPLQPSVDGNTVDPEIEQSNYMRNALEFQASFTILNGKFKGLSAAIRGE